MGFSGIGIWEILLILIVALIVLGPTRLPEVARTLGKTIRAIRKASTDLTTTVARELEVKEKETPPQPKEESSAETGKTPSAISQASSPNQDDPPTKPEEASAAK